MNQSIILITEQAVETLNEAAARSHPYETGGVLVGVYAEGKPWITGAIEIPSNDRGRNHYRLPRGSTQPSVRAARAEDNRVGYLGDWHSHPADSGPSATDFFSLRIISYRRPLRPRPTMIVVRRRTDHYVLDAYQTIGMKAHACVIRTTGALDTSSEGDG